METLDPRSQPEKQQIANMSLMSTTYADYTVHPKMYIHNFKPINKILHSNKDNVCTWTLPLEGSKEALSVGSGDVSGHGWKLLVEFSKDLTDVSIL